MVYHEQENFRLKTALIFIRGDRASRSFKRIVLIAYTVVATMNQRARSSEEFWHLNLEDSEPMRKSRTT